MASVFLSYDRDDTSAARVIATALEKNRSVLVTDTATDPLFAQMRELWEREGRKIDQLHFLVDLGHQELTRLHHVGRVIDAGQAGHALLGARRNECRGTQDERRKIK